MEAQKETIAVNLKAAPMVLRVDEMIEGPMGIKEARMVGEIPLVTGINQVDADLWRRWLEQHKDNPLVTGGHVKAQGENDAEGNSEQAAHPAGDGSGPEG